MTDKPARKKPGPPRKPCPDKVCERCGKTFSRKQNDPAGRWDGRKYCSRKCRVERNSCPFVAPSVLASISQAAARKATANKNDHDEIAQECVVYALSHLGTFKGDHGRIRKYLAWIMCRQARFLAKQMRSKSALLPFGDDEDSPQVGSIDDPLAQDPSDIAASNELVAEADRIIRRWPKPKRMAFEAIHVLGLNPHPAAVRLKMPIKKVSSLASRGLAELKRKMLRRTA